MNYDYRPFLPRPERRGGKPLPPDLFTDVECPECYARPGEPCGDDPPRKPGATAHPRRVDRALYVRLRRRRRARA